MRVSKPGPDPWLRTGGEIACRIRIATSALLKSRLASASVGGLLRRVPKALLDIALRPTRKAMPLARKPITGITASTMMRVRTETAADEAVGDRADA